MAMAPTHPTDRLLERLLAAWPDRTAMAGLAARVTDWGPILQRARAHGVMGILQNALLDAGELPCEGKNPLAERRALEQLWHERLGESLQDVLDALAGAALRPILLKGPLLAERLYAEPALRPSLDLDVLLEPGHLDSAMAALQTLGYRPPVELTRTYEWQHHHHWELSHPSRPRLELHFRLFTGFGVKVEASPFFERAQPWVWRGRPCLVLAPEDEFFYLAVHAAGHDFSRLAWLLDLKAFFLRFHPLDWNLLVERARTLGLGSALAFSLEELHRRLGISVPVARLPNAGRWNVARRLLVHANENPALLASHLASLGFQALLCDHPHHATHHLTHHVGRMARRRLFHWFPWLFPVSWSA